MSLAITQVILPVSKYDIKCPYAMTPDGLTIHNTANDASAMAEVSYMQGNNNYVSFHYAVDNERAVQGLPLDRNGWHAGDGGTGKGNRTTIGLEICYSKSGGDKFIQAEKNGALLAAMILKSHGWGIDRMGKHQDYDQGGWYKYCPHRTLDMGWARFVNMVKAELAKLNGQSEITETTETTTTNQIGGIAMFTYQEEGKATIYGVWGNKSFGFKSPQELKDFRNIVKDTTGRTCKHYTWKKGQTPFDVVKKMVD